MQLFIDGIARGDLEAEVAVVAIPDELSFGTAPAVLAAADLAMARWAVWVPSDTCARTATIADDSFPGWPIITTLDAVAAAQSHFAWGAELGSLGVAMDPGTTSRGPRSAAMSDRVATWTALIDAGARVVITRHVAEARRVAMLASDLLALQVSAIGE